MEQSPSHQPPSLTPAISSSGQSEYWCYYCDTTALVKTLAHSSQIVCCECNCGFVESISSISVSSSPQSLIGEGNEFAEETHSEIEQGGDENVIDDEIEEDGENQDEFEGSESDDDYEDDETDNYDDEDEEEEEQNIENFNNNNNSALETGISDYFRGLDTDNLRVVLRSLVAILSDDEHERMSLEDHEDETDGDERTGAPPAAESVVSSLKTVDVEVEKDVIHCAVCKDLVSVGEVAKELGCGHGYHEECILPWLGLRNTCPVCRFEMPTDDADYEEKRKKILVAASASVSSSPDHFSGPQSMVGEDDEFAEGSDSGNEKGGGDAFEQNEEECVTDDEIEEEEGENDDEIKGSESDDEYEDSETDDNDDEEEEEEQNIENRYNNSALESGISDFLEGLDHDNLLVVMSSLVAILSDRELERMSLEVYEDETDGDVRTGVPPADESIVFSQTFDVEEKKDVIHCVLCKDVVNAGEVAKELGCGHGYHEVCVFPWLGLRNTCPVCMFAMPTDDADYEEKRKKNLVGASASGNSPGLD